MNDAIKNALVTDRTIDITTMGRKSGQPRRIEIWFHNIEGKLYITGQPGTRSWYANMVTNPDFIFHLKGSARHASKNTSTSASSRRSSTRRWAAIANGSGSRPRRSRPC